MSPPSVCFSPLGQIAAALMFVKAISALQDKTVEGRRGMGWRDFLIKLPYKRQTALTAFFLCGLKLNIQGFIFHIHKLP